MFTNVHDLHLNLNKQSVLYQTELFSCSTEVFNLFGLLLSSSSPLYHICIISVTLLYTILLPFSHNPLVPHLEILSYPLLGVMTHRLRTTDVN